MEESKLMSEEIIQRIIDGEIESIHFDRILAEWINNEIYDHHED